MGTRPSGPGSLWAALPLAPHGQAAATAGDEHAHLYVDPTYARAKQPADQNQTFKSPYKSDPDMSTDSTATCEPPKRGLTAGLAPDWSLQQMENGEGPGLSLCRAKGAATQVGLRWHSPADWGQGAREAVGGDAA